MANEKARELAELWTSQDPLMRDDVLDRVLADDHFMLVQTAWAIGDFYGQNAWRVKVQDFFRAVLARGPQPLVSADESTLVKDDPPATA